ncbi:MAG: hypothetical protein B6245_10700 [Desulfobacteraceae bacterium 4572_88]|nr:MAG: hypothetical protein B6245_10700 [Desulfobacteraceae bacterium 4572_88]
MTDEKASSAEISFVLVPTQSVGTSSDMKMKPFSIILILFCTLLAQATGWAGDPAPHLLVRDYVSQKILLDLPVRYGDSFTIRYIHSVDISPVFEVFRIEKGTGLVLEETYFRMFGAGMGHWQGHGILTHDGTWTRIQDINDKVGRFILRVGSKGVDHTILFGEQAINLSDIAAGRRVEIFVSGQGD